MSSCQAVWLSCRACDKHRLRLASKERKTFRPRDLYTSKVIGELAELPGCRERDLTVDRSVEDWQAECSKVDGAAVGLVLLKSFWRANLMSLLRPEQQILRDMWYCVSPDMDLVMVDIADVVAFDVPVPIRPRHVNAAERGAFFNISEISHQRLFAAVCQDGRSPHTVLSQWAVGVEGVSDELAREWGNGNLQVALSIFTPIAMLCAAKRWASLALPFAEGRRGKGLGFHYVSRLAPAAQIRQQQFDVNGVGNVTPDILQQTTDIMRKQALGLPVDAEEVCRHIAWLDRLRAKMVTDLAVIPKSAYKMEYLLKCLLFSGYIKDVADTTSALLAALPVLISDAGMRSHFEAMIRTPFKIPSRQTLYRHRLTLHLGYCSLQAQLNSNMLRVPGGLSCWQTVDASPNMGYEWLMHGCRAMPCRDLAARFQDALALFSSPHRCGETINVEPELKRLREQLGYQPGVVTAVGSGRADLPHKLHATVHSKRLATMSWREAATMMNCSVTFVGDLGTESRYSRSASHIRDMFGPWALADDAAKADGGMESDNDEFVFEPAAVPDGPDAADGYNDEFAFEPVAVPDGPDAADVDVPDVDDSDLAQLPLVADGLEPGTAEDVHTAHDYPLPMDPYAIDLRNAVFIAGVLHIFSNIMAGLMDCMSGFGTFLKQLSAVCRLLKKN